MNQPGAKVVSIPLSASKNAALQFCSLISQSCHRIEIAGSIRRKRSYVHDIDIVVIPRFVHVPPKTLFGDPEETSELERRLC
jgi:DNA polymerase/3'-5' exonuclease PolX